MCRRSVPAIALLAALLASLLVLSGCNTQPTGNATSANAQPGKLASLQGQVLLATPDPVSSHTGISVYLAGTSFQARTSAVGTYRIDNIPAGTYEIQAEKPGFRPALVDSIKLDPAKDTPQSPAIAKVAILELASTDTSANASGALGSVQGVVYLQGQEKSGGVRIQLDGTSLVAVSADDGAYHLVNVPAGTYSMTFTATNYQPYTATGIIVTAGSPTTVADAALERSSQPVLIGTPGTAPAAAATPVGTPIVAQQMSGDRVINGIVQLTDASGQPVTDFNRAVVAINDSDIVATLDEEGRFRIANLSAGVFTLLGSLDNGEPTKLPVDLTTQQTATVIMKISGAAAQKAKGSVIGRVVLPGNDDKPMPDASGVRVSIAGTQSSAVSAKDGSFKLEDVPEGSYSVIATKDGFEDLNTDGVEVAANAPTDMGELTLEPKRDYPRVVATIPANGTHNIPVGLDIVLQVKFSKPMNPDSVRNAVSVLPQTAAQYLFGRGSHPLADDNTLVVVLSSLDQKLPIRFSTNYQLAIAKTAADLNGVTMKNDFVMNFATGAPGIIGTRPANGDQQTWVDQNEMPVIVNFNTRLDPGTLNDRNIKVRPDNGMSISVTHTEDPRTAWTNLRVSTNWQADTHYTVTIGRGVRAANGQPLGNTPYTLRFTTQKMDVLRAPIQVIR